MTLRRVGLFGGTFDPPHFGHVAAVRAAVRTHRFNVVEVAVAGDPYQKVARGYVRPAAVRLAMARAAFAEIDHVVVSDREVRRRGPSYTVDSVRELLAEVDEVDLLIGADLVEGLDEWHEAGQLRAMVRVGVVPRPGARPQLPGGWVGYEIPMDPVDLSSSFVRSLTPDRDDLEVYIPTAVIPLYQASNG